MVYFLMLEVFESALESRRIAIEAGYKLFYTVVDVFRTTKRICLKFF